MTVVRHFWLRRAFLLLFAITIFHSAHRTISAQQIDALLANGEFAAAQRFAQQQSSSAMRDQMLGRIATAQFRAGAPRASFATAGSMSSDRSRSQALSGFVVRRLAVDREALLWPILTR